MRLDFFVKFKKWSITKIISISVKYSLRDLLFTSIYNLLDEDLCKNFFDFLLFPGFNHDFVIYIDFTHVAASKTATDDVTN